MSSSRLALVCLLAACSSTTDEDIRGQVTLLLNQEGAPARAAKQRLEASGKRAIPTIEAALHTATPAGKKNLISVLRTIGDAAAIPLLGHIAVYEPAPDVRQEALFTLQSWAAEQNPRGEQARAALRAADEARQREEAG
jgi:hypothetical protein